MSSSLKQPPFSVPLQQSPSHAGINLQIKESRVYTVGRDFTCSIILNKHMFKIEENLQFNKAQQSLGTMFFFLKKIAEVNIAHISILGQTTLSL